MIYIRKSQERGYADQGWLKTFHTFSFARYYDPRFTGFHSLRVINEDRVAVGKGFGLHPHNDMEIISYVVSGALEHKDSMGSHEIMKAGEVQRISAGKGVLHSEYNGSPDEEVHFLQIWILPDEKHVRPEYTQASFSDIEHDRLVLIASKTARDNSISIHQDADVYVARLKSGKAIEHPVAPGRGVWIQIIEGELSINGKKTVVNGDGAAIEDIAHLTLTASKNTHFLLFDMQ
ncbi:pirin family protein [Oxalobacter paraformigenes]|uniref:Quercetin 2,3-dioxygenase n=1 Tax=Oxalobacter paraformigenes TaxID=556268 RepID=C3X2M4_9BURK|nr:pirin family protein [Oxalobacter paraformigenes]EEO27460.1 hypothetical protein OFAG_00613 [Oxalobacter paraformigenes]